MFIIPIYELDEIVNDHFGSGDAQTQSTNDEAELQEQSKKISNDQELIQSDPISCPQNQKGSN